jgi:transcriptional regulator with XRE-family HTH domain
MATLREMLGIAGNPEREAELEAYSIDMDVAQLVYDLRTEAGLTQVQLARLVGTHASAISRLEDADYEGDSVAMLRRIARALNRRVFLGVAPEEPIAVSEGPQVPAADVEEVAA